VVEVGVDKFQGLVALVELGLEVEQVVVDSYLVGYLVVVGEVQVGVVVDKFGRELGALVVEE
jgi:hypothetical protein